MKGVLRMKGSAILKSIRLKNIRSLADTGEIPICPLTILVGGNSSGKSTFLRTFPLIRQSISKRTDGPILWAGDIDDYVDFGSFKETKGRVGNAIDFSFTFEIENENRPFSHYHDIRKIPALNQPYTVNYSISVRQKPTRFGRGEEVPTFEIELNSHKVVIEHSHSKTEPYKIYVDNSQVPLIEPEVDGPDEKQWRLYRLIYMLTANKTIFEFQMPNLHGIWSQLESFVFQDYNCDTQEEYRFVEILANVFLLQKNPAVFLKAIVEDENAFVLNHKTHDEFELNLKERIKGFIEKYLEADKKKQEEIQKWLILFEIYTSTEQIDEYISKYFRGVHYIAPLRATAERFYRLRNLAVNEIDYQGKNMAVFLNSLSKEQLQNFQDWTQKYFDFVIQLSTKAQHISVRVARSTRAIGVNISDSGFGYSQILPIIAQMWFLTSKLDNGYRYELDNGYRYDDGMPIVIAIEQPELHLHPALQAKLVDAFIACIKNAEEHNRQIQLIIETHSETIVNRIGRNIARKKISEDKAEIVLFDKEFDKDQSKVHISKYDSDGCLIEWPIGFFEAGRI